MQEFPRRADGQPIRRAASSTALSDALVEAELPARSRDLGEWRPSRWRPSLLRTCGAPDPSTRRRWSELARRARRVELSARPRRGRRGSALGAARVGTSGRYPPAAPVSVCSSDAAVSVGMCPGRVAPRSGSPAPPPASVCRRQHDARIPLERRRSTAMPPTLSAGRDSDARTIGHRDRSEVALRARSVQPRHLPAMRVASMGTGRARGSFAVSVDERTRCRAVLPAQPRFVRSDAEAYCRRPLKTSEG